MKCVILVHSLSYVTSRLKDELEKKKIQATLVKSQDVLLSFPSVLEKVELTFNRLSPVRMDEQDWGLLENESWGKQVNALETRYRTRSKLRQLAFFSASQISLIPTLSVKGEITLEKRERISSFFSQHLAPEGFILKPNIGMQGIGVNKIQDQEALFSWLETFYFTKDQDWLIQPFLNLRTEWRVMLLQGKIWAILHKEKHTVKGNFHQGAIGSEIQENALPLVALSLVDQVAKMIPHDYLALDLGLTHDGEVVLFECNGCPGFESLEKITQRSFAKDLIESILK